MAVGIYAFFDLEGTCLYVGQSSDVYQRKKQHLKYLRGGYHKRKEFNDWFVLNGEDALVFKVLEVCSNEATTKNRLEIKYFEDLRPRYYGQTPSVLDRFSQSEETRYKISGSLKKTLTEQGVYTTKKCACGVEYTVTSSRDRVFCSAPCRSRRNNNRKSQLNYDEVTNLYASGLSLSEVGARVGVSYRTVHQFMVKNNIPRRKPGPAVAGV